MSLNQPTWTQVNPAAVRLQTGATGGSVTFPVPFFATPFLVLATAVLASASQPQLGIGIYGVSAYGFSYTLDPVPGDDTYFLTWNATAYQPPPPGCCNPCPPLFPDPSRSPLSGASGTVNLVNGDLTGTVTFDGPFSFAPRVTGSVIKPTEDSDNIFATIFDITTTGFSYNLTFGPGDGYVLDWIAVAR